MAGPRTRVQLRVSAGAARAGIAGRHGEAWKVRVSSPAERGRANEAVLELLATALEISRGSLELSAGLRARDKIVTVAGLSRAEIDRKLAAAAGAR